MACKQLYYVPSFLLAIRVPSAHEGFMLQMVADVRNSTIKPWKSLTTPIDRPIHIHQWHTAF